MSLLRARSKVCQLKVPSCVSRAAQKITKVHTLKPLHSSETVNKVGKWQLSGENSQGMKLGWLQFIGSNPSTVTTTVSE